MANNFVPVLCHFNGVLYIDAHNRPRYDGGEVKILKVSKSTTYEQLKELIYRRTRINPAEFELKLVCKHLISVQEFTSVILSDTKDLERVLAMHTSNFALAIYIEKEPVQVQDQFTRMLGDAYESPLHQLPITDEGTSHVPTTFSEDTVAYNDFQVEQVEAVPSSSHYPVHHAMYVTTSRCNEDVGPVVPREIECHIVQNSLHFIMREHEDDQWVHNFYVNDDDVECEDIHPVDSIDADALQSYDVLLDMNISDTQWTMKFICQCILPILKTRLDTTPAMIQDHIKLNYHKDISYYKAWQVRTKALTHLFRDWDQSYQELPRYLNALCASNPGSVYKLKTDDAHYMNWGHFECVFWAFGPSISGFRHCRPVLSVDGTHLYGKYSGMLLVATGVDADGGLYPLAFAVVDTESRENWEWFFSCIRTYIPTASGREITWISDRMKGLPNALQHAWKLPHHHRYCLRFIKANFKSIFKDEALQNFLYRAGSTPDALQYIYLRNRIREISPDADAWIERSLGPQNESCWALSKDEGKRFCIMTTNCFESFNGVLKGARALPIVSLVARTFYRLNTCFVSRRENAETWVSTFTPKVEKLLKDRNNESRSFRIQQFSIDNWEVVDTRGLRYDVHITGDECKCSCNMPLLQKLPCAHVIAATSRASGGTNVNFGALCSKWYSAENYRRSYEPIFRPIPDNRYWPKVDPTMRVLLPPKLKRKNVRPRSTQITNEMDMREGDRKKLKCSKCNQYGHNRRRCTIE